MLLLLLACAAPEPPIEPDALPDPGAWTRSGPGGPAVPLDAPLDQPCAALTGGPEDVEHHNLVGIHDGWLLLPWAPEDGGGGLSVFDVSDPCAPVKVGEAYAPIMRESHTLGIGRVGDRTFLAVDTHHDDDRGGIGFWELTDPTAPTWVTDLELPDYDYPDAYFRVTLSTFWQGDRLYVSAGFNGVFVVDVSDPTAPVLVDQWVEPGFLAGSFHVIGNLAMASSAGLGRTLLWDVGDPDDWQLLADWEVTDEAGDPLGYYFANVGGRYGLFARKTEGGGPVVYDLADPEAPVRLGAGSSPDGDGGYVFRHHDLLFQGESNFGARYDFTDPADPVEIARFDMAGDLDTVTPIGNVAVVSVDEGADPGLSTQVFPFAAAPDARGPAVELTSPRDGETWVPLQGRVGLSFDEQIEPVSLHAGSFRVWRADGRAVPGRFYGQESIANFVPDAPLEPDTTYVVEVPAGGVADVSGNPTEATLRFSFATGAAVEPIPW